MLNRIICSNEGKLKNNIEQTAVKVLETYTYKEIFIPPAEDASAEIVKAAEKYFADEISPLRLYNINNHGIAFSIIKEKSIRAYAEIVLLCVNIALAIDLKDFFINVSAGEEILTELKETVSSYGIDGYVKFEKGEKTTFSGNFNGKAFLLGQSGENHISVCFDMEALLELLYTDKIRNASDIPLIVVGSENDKALHETAFGLRAKGLTVETFIKKGTMYEAEEYAELKNITILMWITEEGKIIMKNVKNGEMSETTLDKVLKAAE